MAYNNFGYPNYSYYQTPQILPQNNPTPQNLIWVQGEAGAKSYLVAPNSTVTLWDTESQTIYIKSADASGMPTMKVLDYSVRNGMAETHKIPPQSGFDSPMRYQNNR